MRSSLSLNLRYCHPSFSSPFRALPLLEHKSLRQRFFSLRNRKLHLSQSGFPTVPAASTSSSMGDSHGCSEASKPYSVLFVCLGNICRSPAAEAVFSNIVHKRGLDSKFKIDSAGTIGYHEGNPADPRMRAAAKKRGILVTSISRPVRPLDFVDFDLIIAMDLQNKDDLLNAFERWSHTEALPEDAYKKIKLMCSYCRKHTETEVPDPYYGGPQGFEKVLNILEDGCEVLLDEVLAEKNHSSFS
ncbi:hypothetical protein HPP92_013369 [Vanilla planifolia]|uniref:acid phosphatase n=1 Tax=Vanilla planifolia TaxID=51239 RepID=A0A835QP33_VANPL|nr:hypothetical protein HPP92_013801 [Vanilla planifolia]KAG0478650.1 hypothetical protein HPP92_013369 [Vanilla planifolia]